MAPVIYKSIVTLLLISFVSILTACCPPRSMVVLQSEPDGTTGSIIVSTAAGSVELNKSNQATRLADQQSPPGQPTILSDTEINKRFGPTLSALPDQPEHFLLYFLQGSAELTPESTKLIISILQSIKEHNSQYIDVIGHTDTVGDEQGNIRISQQRAQMVRDALIQRGVNPDHIRSSSHGETNQLVKTADNVPEPKNRRVEVVVR